MVEIIIDRENNEYKVYDIDTSMCASMETEALAQELYERALKGEDLEETLYKIEYREYGICWGNPGK